MGNTQASPKTLLEATRYFSDPTRAFEFARDMRWPSGVVCPFCGGNVHSFIATRRIWQCKPCKRQFSVKKGTIFEDSPIGLDKWLVGFWLILNAKNGISSHELHRSLGVTQKTAWFMLHRIRLAMQNGSLEKLVDHVEVDETYIGGKARNMHKHVRDAKIKGRGSVGKAIVMGMLERGGRVITHHIQSTDAMTLQTKIRLHVDRGARVSTDAHKGYVGLSAQYRHGVVDHAVTYVEGQIHTNGIENFWSLLKRTLKGTYISVEPFHLHRYLDEQTFRFNERKLTDGERFQLGLSMISGKRLTYRRLTGKESVA